MPDDNKPGATDAFALFPDIMKQGAPPPRQEASPQQEAPPPESESLTEPPEPGGKLPEPPGPPNVNTVLKGATESRAALPDLPTALILMSDENVAQRAVETFGELDFEVERATTVAEALEKLKKTSLAAVVLQEGFAGQPLEKSEPHRFMCLLPMERRRYIYYTLVGPKFHTMYDLEAFSASANLVVNAEDIQFFGIILRKGYQDYEKLFRPYIELLKEYSKK